MGKDEILVVKIRAHVSGDVMQKVHRAILAQRDTGVIVLPAYLDATVVSGDIQIQTVEDDSILDN